MLRLVAVVRFGDRVSIFDRGLLPGLLLFLRRLGDHVPPGIVEERSSKGEEAAVDNICA